jgi:RNA polymerase sigma factor (sigma-70 family)
MDRRTLWPRIELLYRSELGQFARVACAITGDRESALEAVQEGFADALGNAEQWSGRGSLEGWVWRCVVNRARKTTPHRAPVVMPERNGRHAKGDPELRACLAALPERQRLVVFLRYFADMGYREIAETLEIEVGTISATLHAAHDSLRASLQEAHT